MNPEATVPATQDNLANVPSAWPGAFGAYKYSRQAVVRNIWLILGLFVVIFGVSIGSSLPKSGVLIQLLGNVLTFFGSVLLIRVYLAGVRGRVESTNELFGGNLVMLAVKMFCLNLLVAFTFIGSFLLFIIPAFFVMPRLTLASYYLIDKNMGVFESYGASWAATKGNVGKVYGLFGVNFLFALIMITIIGIPFALYFLLMYSASTAVLYEVIGKQRAVPASA